MEFKDLEKEIINTSKDYLQRYNLKMDDDFALSKLYEEVGELAQAILIHKKKCRPEKNLTFKESKKNRAKELADIIGMVIVNANLLNIDLVEAIEKKWITKEWIK
ncbi:MazG nucleotide pyrophosphohydrolase domain-containing protein [Patescibacteria group bacterium]